MDIQNFRYYLQDATNFFTVLDYKISDEPYEYKDRKFLNWLFDPFKEPASEFFVSEHSFIVRKVVEKNEANSALLSVFDGVVRYFSFCEFVKDGNNIKYGATKTKKNCFLVANFVGNVHTLVGVRMYFTRTKAVVESFVLEPTVIEELRELGVTHRDPEVLEPIGIDAVVPVVNEVVGTVEQAFLSRRFMFDEITGTNADGDVQSALVTMSAKQILEEYWEFWSEQMKSRGKDDLVTFENCINDFCVVNWAWEVDANGNKI